MDSYIISVTLAYLLSRINKHGDTHAATDIDDFLHKRSDIHRDNDSLVLVFSNEFGDRA